MTLFYAVVYYSLTGWHVLMFDNQPMCDHWLASNATRLHGALYANGVTKWNDPLPKRCVKVKRP